MSLKNELNKLNNEMTNNPFEQHEIKHLSASSINTYIADPCLFVLRYLYKHRSPSNPAMWRGTIVDESIGRSLGWVKTKKKDKIVWVNKKKKISDKEVQRQAINQFDGLHKHYLKEKVDVDETKAKREKSLIPFYLDAALPFYKELDKPLDYQKEINLQFDDLPIPIIGFIDLQYDGIVRDVKTTGRLPSVMPSAVARQLSIYAVAENSTPIADYIYATKSKNEVVSMFVDDVDFHIATVRKVANTIMNLLSYSNDVKQIADLFYPNFDDWRWSKTDIETAKKLWR